MSIVPHQAQPSAAQNKRASLETRERVGLERRDYVGGGCGHHRQGAVSCAAEDSDPLGEIRGGEASAGGGTPG